MSLRAKIVLLCAAAALIPALPALGDGMPGAVGPLSLATPANGPVTDAAPASAAEIFTVTIDQTRMLHLGQPAATIVVGNPTIADVSLRDSTTAFVLGRSFGITNLIALDAQGNEISNTRVSVTPVSGAVVVVSRGAKQFNYACAPKCEPMLVPGDAAFAELIEQAVKKLGFGTDVARASGEGQ